MAILIDADSATLSAPGTTTIGPADLDAGIYQLVSQTGEITSGDVARVYVESRTSTSSNQIEYASVDLISTSFPLLHTIGPITLPADGVFTFEVISLVGAQVYLEWDLIQLATIDPP